VTCCKNQSLPQAIAHFYFKIYIVGPGRDASGPPKPEMQIPCHFLKFVHVSMHGNHLLAFRMEPSQLARTYIDSP